MKSYELASFKDIYELLQREKIKSLLESSSQPLFESTLLRIAFPNIKIFDIQDSFLYKFHFVLFHYLYNLYDFYQKENKFLYIHFMRTKLFEYPKKGLCHFFDESKMKFCNLTSDNNDYCNTHISSSSEYPLEDFSKKLFYSDEMNFDLTFHIDENFKKASKNILFNYPKYKKSLKLLNATESDSTEIIRKKFRNLAKNVHPDKSTEISETFIKINNAYRFILKIREGV